MIENDFGTATGDPSNGGTCAPRNADATHPPTAVPANGGPSTVADVTLPLGAKVTRTLPEPVGPSSFLQPFAAPFVSTFATYPMMVDDQVLTLTDRINGCMRRSLNGKDVPSEGREREAIVAYLKFVGKGTPEGVRVPGMGLRPIENPTSPPDARRGEAVYVQLCVTCHKEDGQGQPKPAPRAVTTLKMSTSSQFCSPTSPIATTLGSSSNENRNGLRSP